MHSPQLWCGNMNSVVYQKSFPARVDAWLCRTEMDTSMASPQPKKPTRQNPQWCKTHLDLEHAVWTQLSMCLYTLFHSSIHHSCTQTHAKQDVWVRAKATVLHLQIVQTDIQYKHTYTAWDHINAWEDISTTCNREWVLSFTTVAAGFSPDCRVHSIHFQPWPGHTPKTWTFQVLIVTGLICGGTKVSSSARNLLSSTFQSISQQKWKNKHKAGFNEWWFPRLKAAYTNPTQYCKSPYVPFIISLVWCQIYVIW